MEIKTNLIKSSSTFTISFLQVSLKKLDLLEDFFLIRLSVHPYMKEKFLKLDKAINI